MKKKYIKTTVIIVLILILITCGPILMTYKPSRLICVGQVNINHDATPLGFYNGLFDYFNKEDLERELIWLSELDTGRFVLNQDEIDEIVDAANQYENYPTVILSDINSKVFWTRLKSPHVGYMNLHDLIDDGLLTYDDVLYVYVTKCDEIDDRPIEWDWK